LSPGASWAPLPDGLIVALGSWYGTARGQEAVALRDQLLTGAEPTASLLVQRLLTRRVLTRWHAPEPLCGPPGDAAGLIVDERALTPALVGPYVEPGRTGCPECWRLRRASLTKLPFAYRTLLAEGRAFAAGPERRAELKAAAVRAAARGETGVAYELTAYGLIRHPFLPVPGCPDCGGSGHCAKRLELDQLMVSSLTGPVVSLTATSVATGMTVVARGVSIDLAHRTTRLIGAQGHAATETEARQRALGEFAERLAMSEPPFTQAAQGCPLSGHTVEVRDLATGQRARMPATGYYLHPPACEFNAKPDRPSTNGAAAGADYWSAAARGLLELLERDALMLTWRWDLRRPRWGAYTDLSYLHGVPTLVCQHHGAVGSAADRTLAAAARRASAEAHAVHSWLKDGQPADDIADFTDHALYYLKPSRRDQLTRLLPDDSPHSAAPDLPSDDQALVELLANRLAGHGIRVYAADLSTPWMLASGLHVVVVRSPQLYPLELGFGSAEVAEGLRWRVGAARPALLDPVPLA
jgi:ribosomal protein S12 methylthiotransferase accessory factor YcaO